jgi:hypothetical protein
MLNVFFRTGQQRNTLIKLCDVQLNLEVCGKSYILFDFDLTSAIICQNQCKLAKVQVSTHDFQCFRQTAYSFFY